MISKAVMLTAGLVMATVVSAEVDATNATAGSECKRLYDEGEKVCTGKNSTQICDAAGECQQMVAKAMNACTDDDKYFDDMENKTKYYKEEIGSVIMMCSSDCFKAVLDSDYMGCFGSEDGPPDAAVCGQACSEKMAVLSTCSEEFPGSFDGDGNPMKISDLSMGPAMLCSSCWQAYQKVQEMQCWEAGKCDACADTVDEALQACESEQLPFAQEVLPGIQMTKSVCDPCKSNYMKLISDNSCFSSGFCGSFCEDAYKGVMSECTGAEMMVINGQEQSVKNSEHMGHFEQLADSCGSNSAPSPYSAPSPSPTCMSVKIPSSIARMYKVRHC